MDSNHHSRIQSPVSCHWTRGQRFSDYNFATSLRSGNASREEGLAGVANALGWSTVAIYLLLALGYGYFLRAGPSGEQRKGRSASVISRRTNPVQPQDG